MARRRILSAPNLTISLPNEGDSVAPDFSVSGTGLPTAANVVGALTDKNTGATFLSDNQVTIDNLQNWQGLTFSNIPPSDYVLAVNEVGTQDGADAVNITVAPTSTVTLSNPQPSGTTYTVEVESTDPNELISVVVVGSKPKHGTPSKQSGKHTVTFKGLKRGTTYQVFAYSLRKQSKGAKTAVTI